MRRGVLLAAAGSGGKTTALGLLARELAEHSVLLTTTTHIFPVSPPRSRCLLKDPDELQLLHALRRPGVVCAGTHAAEGKLGPLPLPLLMRAAKEADVTLCEADGARGKPLKLHRPGEPVIPPGTDLCLLVAGLSALGRPVGETVHRYGRNPRWEAEPDRLVGREELLLCVEEGIAACGGAGEKLRILLNQADTPDRCAAAAWVAAVLRKKGISCRVGDLKTDASFLRPWLLGG